MIPKISIANAAMPINPIFTSFVISIIPFILSILYFQDFMKIIENKELIQNIKNLGFRFVTLDLEGIRSGGYDIENTRNSTKG